MTHLGRKKITSALISVYSKENIAPIINALHKNNVQLISTGGTADFIEKMGIPVQKVENITSYPSIFGGRVKTLHPKIFGGILYRRNLETDAKEALQYGIPPIDLVVVDLYPFEKTVEQTQNEDEIIEKIDIGGISLIRAAAKNFQDVLIVPASDYFDELLELIENQQAETSVEDRRRFATYAFQVSSHYDTAIFNYFNTQTQIPAFKKSVSVFETLRYGENPHQKGYFFGKLNDVFTQLHGKTLSYNNLLDVDAGLNLINDFEQPTIAILKHNNPCGLATRTTLSEAWVEALAGDPVSAYGGVIVANRKIDEITAQEINKLFFEVILAPGYENAALELLQSKKNRVILDLKNAALPADTFRSVLNGALWQERDSSTEKEEQMRTVTIKSPSASEIEDLIFANKIVKHCRSNAIVLAKNQCLIAAGVGQTSRIDALKQAIEKAREFGKDLQGAVMASDAFMPFNDVVSTAHQAGITAVVQPGGSVRDQDSVDFCNDHTMSMVFTGIRHFKH